MSCFPALRIVLAHANRFGHARWHVMWLTLDCNVLCGPHPTMPPTRCAGQVRRCWDEVYRPGDGGSWEQVEFRVLQQCAVGPLRV